MMILSYKFKLRYLKTRSYMVLTIVYTIDEIKYSLNDNLTPLKNVWVSLYGIPQHNILIEYINPERPINEMIFNTNLTGVE